MWLLLMLACAEPAPEAPAPPPAKRPFVLVLTLDTTRADRLGAWGYAAARTPTLDALAARGTRFSRAYTVTPLTIPSHATLFTGLYPPRHGVTDNGDARLSDAAETLAERLSARGWRTHAAVAAFVTRADWGFGQGFHGYDDALGIPSDRLSWTAERRADAVIDDAIRAVPDTDFLWVHLFDAHAPYEPPEPYRSEHPDRPYDGEIAFMDAQIARLLAVVPDDALIVVAGDHGEGFGDEGEHGHGLLLTEGTLHVPLIVAGPGVPAGVVDHPVSLADVTPTLLRRLDVPYDAAALDGRDLFDPAPRGEVWSETRYGQHHFGWSPLFAVTNPGGRLIRGTRDEVRGDPGPGAVAALERIAAARPAWEPPPITLGAAELEQLQALGYVAGAAPTAASAGSVDPRDGIAAFRRLEGLDRMPPERREQTLRALLADAPDMHDARLRLALLLASRGAVDEAHAELLLAFERSPDSTTANTIGDLWLQRGDPAEALGWFREALARDPRSPAAKAGEITALAQLGALDEAAAQADLVLAEAPDHGDVVLARATLALARGEPPGPWLEPVDTLARTRPWQARVLQVSAALRRAAGDAERAEVLLEEELARRPGNGSARLELYDLHLEQGRAVDALKTIRPLLDREPDEPRWHALAARAYLAMGRDDKARPHRDRCAGLPGCP